MKGISKILILLLFLSMLSCKTRMVIVCGFPGTFEGEGLESELIQYESVVKMDTILALVNTKVTYVSEEEIKVENGIGVTVLVRKPVSDEMLIGGVTNIDGTFKTFIEAGIYDIEFSYSGCNSLILRNVKLISGEMKEVDVRLGIQGKESKKYEIDLKEK